MKTWVFLSGEDTPNWLRPRISSVEGNIMFLTSSDGVVGAEIGDAIQMDDDGLIVIVKDFGDTLFLGMGAAPIKKEGSRVPFDQLATEETEMATKTPVVQIVLRIILFIPFAVCFTLLGFMQWGCFGSRAMHDFWEDNWPRFW